MSVYRNVSETTVEVSRLEGTDDRLVRCTRDRGMVVWVQFRAGADGLTVWDRSRFASLVDVTEMRVAAAKALE